MIALFHDAGLKQPTMLCEIPVAGGPDSPFYAEMALTGPRKDGAGPVSLIWHDRDAGR